MPDLLRWYWQEYLSAIVRATVRLFFWAVIWSLGVGLLVLCFVAGQHHWIQ